jgi:hypothetical protein
MERSKTCQKITITNKTTCIDPILLSVEKMEKCATFIEKHLKIKNPNSVKNSNHPPAPKHMFLAIYAHLQEKQKTT